jgi:ABC-2 type transport system permease protein
MMAALLLAELRRITTRRLVRVTVLLTVVGISFGGLAAFAFSGSLSEEAYQQRVEEAKERQIAQDEQIEACLRDHDFHGDGPVPQEIAEECFPDKAPAGVDDPRFTRDDLEGILYGVSGALAVVGWALGASLVGAEFASRGMTTLLTWEPRRARVFAAKTAAAVGATAVFAFVALGLVAVAMWPALALHGAPLQADDPTLWSLAGIVARGVALTAITSAMGLAIATIGRNTAVALGAGFAYIIVLENILGSSVERWRRWLLLGNVIVLVAGEDSASDVTGRTVVGAAIFLSAVAVTLLVAAGTSFRARDLA